MNNYPPIIHHYSLAFFTNALLCCYAPDLCYCLISVVFNVTENGLYGYCLIFLPLVRPGAMCLQNSCRGADLSLNLEPFKILSVLVPTLTTPCRQTRKCRVCASLQNCIIVRLASYITSPYFNSNDSNVAEALMSNVTPAPQPQIRKRTCISEPQQE